MFSIIIPVYNVQNYIAGCIDSVLAQEPGTELEIILIDDGSTDNSGKLCDKYARKYPFVKAIHKEHGGLSDARNTGIAQAKGDYILFLDGDDQIAGGSLQHIHTEMIQQHFPDLVFLECTKVWYGRDGKIRKAVPMGDGVTGKVRTLAGARLLDYFANLPKYPASACTKAIKRELFLKYGLRFKKGLLHEDLEWCVGLLLHTKSAGYCGSQYYLYRQDRAGSITASPCEKSAWDTLRTAEHWLLEKENYQSQAKRHLASSLVEYMFRFLPVKENLVSKSRKKEYRKRVRACSHVLGTRRDTASRMVALAYRVAGIRGSGVMLRCGLRILGFKRR